MIDANRLARNTVDAFGGEPLLLPDCSDVALQEWAQLSAVASALAVRQGVKVIGVSGSQGSGKSTCAQILVQLLGRLGVRAVTVSLDDFYLTREQRRLLGEQVHPLLQTRGVPGTHDTGWLGEVLRQMRADDGALQLPQFDKGADDRAGVRSVEADVLVLEGWCLGVTRQPPADLAEPINALEAGEDADGHWREWVNAKIAEEYEPLWPLIDLWIHLRAPRFDVVHAWRTQQEQDLPPAQRMSEAEIGRFIAHYERLTRWQLGSRPPGPGYLVELDAQRVVKQVTVSSASRL